MIALTNVTFYDFETYKEGMYILFDETIEEVGSMKQYKNKAYQEINCHNKLVMPGLINGHSHIYSTFSRGLNVPFNPTNFQEILEQLWWKLDRNIDNETTYYSGIVSGVEYLKHGVTSVIDHHASGEIINSLETLKEAVTNQVGLRGIYCFESSDRFNMEHCIKENKDFIENNKSTSATGLFGMHAQFTLSDDSLNNISKHLKAPIHIHVAESKLDQELALKNHKSSVIERLNKYNLISKDSLLVHSLYLNEKELEIIKEKEAVVALNITSNMNNGVGLPNYNLLKKHHINMIIGNDGISNSIALEYRNLFFAMHHYYNDPTAFNYDDLLQLINNTYEYTNRMLNTKLGRIKESYNADLVLLDFENIAFINEDNIFGYLLFGDFQDFRPSDVFVAGKQVLKNYQVKAELDKAYKNAKEISKKLFARIEKEGTL